MRRRVILFGPLPPPNGGVSVFVSNLFAHLKDFDVRLWATFGTPTNDERVTRFNHRRLGVVGALARQGRNARIVDFTHFHLEYPHPILLPIWLSAKSLLQFEWFKYILDGSLPERYPKFTPRQRKLFHQAVNSVDEFIVVSPELHDWLKDDLKIKQKVSVIPCLLNIPEESLVQKLSQETATGLKPFFDHKRRVCSIGTFIPSYGFAHVATAIERLRNETRQDIGLVLLDGAFATDEKYRDEVLSGRDWITVLTGLPNTEVYQVLRNCNVFVRAFSSESYGISRVEAIWCGIPVIATDVGETRGMIRYNFGDVEALRDLIRESLDHPDSSELKTWARTFHAEADENLKQFTRTVGLSP
jgi:glycosyltransferase involved in cell wall biosynthesis